MGFFSKQNGKMIFCLIAILCLSSCRWYHKYNIPNQAMLDHPSSIPKLIAALDDPSPNTRASAIAYLKRFNAASQQAIPDLISLAKNDPDSRIRVKAISGISTIAYTNKNRTINNTLIEAMSDSNENVRRYALNALRRMNYLGEDFRQALTHMSIHEPHKTIKLEAIKILANIKAIPKLASREDDLSPPKKTPSLKDKTALFKTNYLPSPPNKHAIAVIIGNRNYKSANKDIPNVDFAHNDANAIHQFVTQALGYREGNIILIKDATQADLSSTFGTKDNPKGRLHDWIRPGKSDVFVFYSGHGAPGLNSGEGYLLPVNADPAKVELNGYPLKTLYANLETLPSRSATVVLDACFSGGSAGGILLKNTSSIALKIIETKPKQSKLVVLTASGPSQTASWDTDIHHGLFTRHFLEGISGAADKNDFGNQDGKITLGELKKYLEEEVAYAARRRYGREQTPKIYGNLNHTFGTN